ncbi:FAD-dependent oxidoreductase [Hyphomonas sp.]|uniref:flavin monoamine oxidase family protein n=1 Tax=Hyphomonas sp. TaxID=87 RepID=UPI0025BC2091|nr:FAD-dependent oxidoreductase [Hyphomonas sp.]
MTTPRVAIIGGGLAGLNAARLLHRAGISFQLFEARDRLGGRILTVDETGSPAEDGFDLGPSWFWPEMQPAIGNLVSELGLQAFAQYSTGDMLFERTAREGPSRLPGMTHQPQSMRLASGSAALIRTLASGLPDGALNTGAAVTALHLTDFGIDVTVARDDQQPERISFNQVIAALPPRLLATVIRWDPAPDPATLDLWQGTPTWMAPHAKFFAVYDHPFWRDAGLSGTAQSMVGPLAEIHDATTASGKAALFGFVGIPAAQRKSIGPETLIRAAIQQLIRLFGPEAALPRATLLKDWAADELTATSADVTAAGHPSAVGAEWVTGAWAGRLLLAGSEASATEPGYLAGAMEASNRIVQAICHRS